MPGFGCFGDAVGGDEQAGGELASTDDVEKTLRVVANRFVRLLTRPAQLRVRRLVIAEAGRFPQLGRAYFELSCHRSIHRSPREQGTSALFRRSRTDENRLRVTTQAEQ